VATGGDARLVWAGEPFLLDEGVAPWSEMPLWIPESDAELRGFFETNCDRAIRAGLTFRPLVETIRDTHAWDATRPRDAPLRAGLSAEREAELLRAWRTASGAPPVSE
jgi:2'-hydroxyisoflavone reductase